MADPFAGMKPYDAQVGDELIDYDGRRYRVTARSTTRGAGSLTRRLTLRPVEPLGPDEPYLGAIGNTMPWGDEGAPS